MCDVVLFDSRADTGAITVVFWGGVECGKAGITHDVSPETTDKDASDVSRTFDTVIVSGSAGMATGMGKTGLPPKR